MMSDIMEKTLNSVSNFFTGNFGPRNLDISPGFDNLLRTVTRSSKEEVDRIIEREMDILKKKLSQPENGVHKIKEYLVRLLYCEMLGHNTAACHIYAVKLSQQASLQEKQIGYLAICMLLHENHELLVLMVNTFQRDLRSSNFLEVSMALTAVSYLGTADMVPVLLPLIQKHISHPRDVVRKKAVMALFSFYRKSPMLIVQSHDLFKKALCDSKPAVMAAALHVFKFLIKEDCDKYKDIVPTLVNILHQVVHHKLHQDFDFHGIPAPWTQITILKMMSILGQGDAQTSLLMHDVLCDVLQQSKQSSSISYALQYECIVTITRIECSQEMLTACSQCIDKFLKSTNHNLKYLGINALSCIVQIDATLAGKHQMVVIDCLNDPDNTIQIKTLELLYKMCNVNNVDVICTHYLQYLQNSKDVYIKKTLLQRVLEMANKYGQKGMWYIDTVNQVLLIAGNQLNIEPRNQIITQIKDIGRWSDADSLHMQVLQVYYKLLSTAIPSEALLQIALWVVGEFWQPEIGAPANEVLELLCKLLTSLSDRSVHSSWLVTSIGKILCKSRIHKIPKDIEIRRNESNVETRQRIFELQEICQDVELIENTSISTQQYPKEVDSTLSFLDEYVSDALEDGATPYIPKQQRHTEPNRKLVSASLLGGLKFEPYQSPTASLASTSTPPKSSNTEEMSMQGSASSPRKAESTENLQLKGIKQVWSKEGYVKKSGRKTSVGEEPKADVSNQESSFSPPMSKTKHKALPLLSSASATAFPSEESTADREKQMLANKLFGGIGNQHIKSKATHHDHSLANLDADQLPVSDDVSKTTKSDFNLLDVDIKPLNDLSTLQLHDPTVASHDETVASHVKTQVSHVVTNVSHELTMTGCDAISISNGATVGSHDITCISHDETVISHDLIGVSDVTDKEPNDIYIVKERNIYKSQESSSQSDLDLSANSGAIGSIEGSLLASMNTAVSQESAIFTNSTLTTAKIDHIAEKSLLDIDEEVTPTIPESLSGFPSSSTHDELCMNDVTSLRMCRVWKPDYLVIVLFLVNKSRSFNLTDITVTIKCPSNLKCYIFNQEINKWNMDNLPPSSVESVAVYFKHTSPSLNMNLGGQLCFRDTNQTMQKLFFSTDITLPDFIRPVTLTTDEFGEKWQSPMLESKFNIEKGRWRNTEQVLQVVTSRLNLHLVQIIGQEGIASGSILGSTPCLLHVKFNEKYIQLWFRTTSKLLAECLVQEAKKHFK